MNRKNKVFQTVKNRIVKDRLINKGDHVILGLSGGADSMCLFSILSRLQESLGFTLVATHINHKLRGEDADNDQYFVEDVCKKAGVECFSFQVDCNGMAEKNQMTVEEAGRELRYTVFNQVAKELFSKGTFYEQMKIATAHNLGDQAETILMKLIRGTGLDGIAGMEYIRTLEEGPYLIRPMLDVEKEDIEEYCIRNSVIFQYDQTNGENDYTRNKIRGELIPFIEENFNPNFKNTIIANTRQVKADRDYIWYRVKEDYKKMLLREKEHEIILDRHDFKLADASIRNRIVLMSFETIGLKKNIGRSHLIPLNEKIDEIGWKGTLLFPKGYCVDLNPGQIRLYNSNCFPAKDPEEEKVIEKPNIKVAATKISHHRPVDGEIILDYDLFLEKNTHLESPARKLELRTRKSGDYLPLKGGNGKKKIQDIFVDEKIPKEDRDKIWMLTLGSEVVWIIEDEVRNRITGKYTASKDTQNILSLSIIK